MQHSTAARPVGQWFFSDGRRWWFDPGALALDFVCTGAMGDDPARETIHVPTDLGVLLSGRFEELAREATLLLTEAERMRLR